MAMMNSPHPGLSVRHDCREPLGLTVTRAAEVLGVTRQTLNDPIHCRRGISLEMAIRLDMAFGGGPIPGCGCKRPTTWPRPASMPTTSRSGATSGKTCVQLARPPARRHRDRWHALRRLMLILVRKHWFDELRRGAKRVEHRRYGPRWNERVFWVGRPVAFAYKRDRVSPRLHGVVTSFATTPLAEVPEMRDIYPDMRPHERIAGIGVHLSPVGGMT